jgi:predicted transcriptional regulator of viral defense system
MSKLKSKNKQTNRGRPTQVKQKLPQLKKLGIFRVRDARQLGISQPTLSRLVKNKLITRLGTGLYVHPDAKISHHHLDYILACSKFGPKSAIGGLTALFHYGLIEQVPQRVWVMVPYNIKTNASLYRCIRTKTNPQVGIQDHGNYKITDLERTLVEAFRYASKIGLRIAFRATRTALVEKRTTLPKLHRQAKALGLENVLERHWEALIPEGQVT